MDDESAHTVGYAISFAGLRDVDLAVGQVQEREPIPLILIGVILGDGGIVQGAYDIWLATGQRETMGIIQMGQTDLDIPHQVPEPRAVSFIAAGKVPADYDIRHACHIRVKSLDA